MMHVERVPTDGGSRIEPRFDESWSEADKLRWLAAVVECDTGVRVRVRDGSSLRKVMGHWKPVPGTYGITTGHSCTSSFDFAGAWTFLSGVSAGAKAASEVTSR